MLDLDRLPREWASIIARLYALDGHDPHTPETAAAAVGMHAAAVRWIHGAALSRGCR